MATHLWPWPSGVVQGEWRTARAHITFILVFYLTSCLTVCFIQNFYINIIYFVMIYFIIRDTLIMIDLFYYLHKKFE